MEEFAHIHYPTTKNIALFSSGKVVPSTVSFKEKYESDRLTLTYEFHEKDTKKYRGIVKLVLPRSYKTPDGVKSGVYIDWIEGRGRGVGLQGIALANQIGRENSLDGCVFGLAAIGSGKYWLKTGFRPLKPMTDEEFIEVAKADGHFDAHAYLCSDKADTIRKYAEFLNSRLK